MELYDIRVTVERIEGRSVCGLAVGDYYEVTESSRLCIPPDPITAALSSMNADLYLTTRMIFSLARNNEAPRASSAA